jgi:hypothetical protein
MSKHRKTSDWWPMQLLGIAVTVGTWVLIIAKLVS